MGLARYNCLMRRAFLAPFMTRPVDLVRYLIAVMSDDLLNTAIHLAAVCFVGYQDTVIPIHDNESFVHRVEDAPDELLTLPNLLLGLLTYSDVLSSTKDTESFTGRITPDNTKSFHHPLASRIINDSDCQMQRKGIAF